MREIIWVSTTVHFFRNEPFRRCERSQGEFCCVWQCWRGRKSIVKPREKSVASFKASGRPGPCMLQLRTRKHASSSSLYVGFFGRESSCASFSFRHASSPGTRERSWSAMSTIVFEGEEWLASSPGMLSRLWHESGDSEEVSSTSWWTRRWRKVSWTQAHRCRWVHEELHSKRGSPFLHATGDPCGGQDLRTVQEWDSESKFPDMSRPTFFIRSSCLGVTKRST